MNSSIWCPPDYAPTKIFASKLPTFSFMAFSFRMKRLFKSKKIPFGEEAKPTLMHSKGTNLSKLKSSPKTTSFLEEIKPI